MPTNVLILGDSHTRTLQSGCEALGVQQHTLTFPGCTWADAGIRYHPDTGLSSSRRKWVQRSAAAFGRKLGHNNMFDAGLPVLMSCFYLGRRVNTLRWNGHDHVANVTSFDDDEIPISEDFLDDYTSSLRGRNFNLIRKIQNKGVPITLVAPPVVGANPLGRLICRRLGHEAQKLGVGYYDPWDDLPGDPGGFPAEFIHPDGRHGNGQYGAFVIQALIDKGILSAAPTTLMSPVEASKAA